MTKVLRCGDFMPGCDYEARAESEGELLQEGGTARARSTRHRNHARADPAGQKQDSGRSLAVNSNKRPLARWARRGLWENLFRELAGCGRSADMQMIDSTHVKAHRSAAGGKGGKKIRLWAVRAEGATRRFMHSQMLKGA